MKAYVFPGQGAQFTGMGQDLYQANPIAVKLFQTADSLLGFSLTDIMFQGSADDLRQTRVTQPAIFVHSVIAARCLEDFNPDMVAGHSLGEFSALTAAGALSFEEGLELVSIRAQAMQKSCEETPSGMAAILGLPDAVIEEVCARISTPEDTVVPANYNTPGQLVISGSLKAIAQACAALKEAGAKRALPLQVGGAFHSPYMESARKALEAAIDKAQLNAPICPIFQNVDGMPHTDPAQIKENLKQQLTHPVRWTTTIQQMIAQGADSFIELGPGEVLQGMIKKIAR